MTDKVFIDTNILVYAYVDTDLDKYNKAREFMDSLIDTEVYISTQILNEVYSALKKNSVNDAETKYYVEYCISKYNILSVTLNDVKKCLDVRERYKYSYWDSLVLATAVNGECTTVYSEDMQNKQLIYSGLRIINPLTL